MTDTTSTSMTDPYPVGKETKVSLPDTNFLLTHFALISTLEYPCTLLLSLKLRGIPSSLAIPGTESFNYRRMYLVTKQ